MCDLLNIYNKILTEKKITVAGIDYNIKNCSIAMDTDILKLNACLSNVDSEITLATEIKNLTKK